MCLIHFLVAKHPLEVIKVLSAQQAPESPGAARMCACSAPLLLLSPSSIWVTAP